MGDWGPQNSQQNSQQNLQQKSQQNLQQNSAKCAAKFAAKFAAKKKPEGSKILQQIFLGVWRETSPKKGPPEKAQQIFFGTFL